MTNDRSTVANDSDPRRTELFGVLPVYYIEE